MKNLHKVTGHDTDPFSYAVTTPPKSPTPSFFQELNRQTSAPPGAPGFPSANEIQNIETSPTPKKRNREQAHVDDKQKRQKPSQKMTQ